MRPGSSSRKTSWTSATPISGKRPSPSLVADFFHVPQAVLRDMPYCQRRARIVGNTVYYGEESDPVLLESICRAVGDDRLVFVHDDHEKRLRDDVRRFSAVQCASRTHWRVGQQGGLAGASWGATKACDSSLASDLIRDVFQNSSIRRDGLAVR